MSKLHHFAVTVDVIFIAACVPLRIFCGRDAPLAFFQRVAHEILWISSLQAELGLDLGDLVGDVLGILLCGWWWSAPTLRGRCCDHRWCDCRRRRHGALVLTTNCFLDLATGFLATAVIAQSTGLRNGVRQIKQLEERCRQ